VSSLAKTNNRSVGVYARLCIYIHRYLFVCTFLTNTKWQSIGWRLFRQGKSTVDCLADVVKQIEIQIQV